MLKIVAPAVAGLILAASPAFAASEGATIRSFDRELGDMMLDSAPHRLLKVKPALLINLEAGQTVAVTYYLKGGKAIATSIVPLTRRKDTLFPF